MNLMRNSVSAVLFFSVLFGGVGAVNAQVPTDAGGEQSVLVDAGPSKAIAADDGFRRAFVKAVSSARKSGDISLRQAVRLRVASFSPAFREQAQELVLVQMVLSGEGSELIPLNDDGTIDRAQVDWDGLIKFLEAFIPLLLALLDSFGL